MWNRNVLVDYYPKCKEKGDLKKRGQRKLTYVGSHVYISSKIILTNVLLP